MNIVKKIDKTVFETAQDFSGKDLVGRWYEDGWLEGYCLLLYDDYLSFINYPED